MISLLDSIHGLCAQAYAVDISPMCAPCGKKKETLSYFTCPCSALIGLPKGTLGLAIAEDISDAGKAGKVLLSFETMYITILGIYGLSVGALKKQE